MRCEPFEDGVSGAEDTVEDVKVARFELLDEGGQQVGPPLGKVLLAHNADGVAELALDLLGTGEHELGDGGLDGLAILGVHLVDEVVLLVALPVALHVVLERDGRADPQMHGQLGLVAQHE